MTINPTAEQHAIIDQYLTGGDLVVEAGAGTGKSSTLRMLGQADPARRGLYLAFNRAIADDADRTFPRNIACRTAHSIAYRAVSGPYQHRLKAPRLRASDVATILADLAPAAFELGLDAGLARKGVASVASITVTRFQQSADPEPMPAHVPYVHGIRPEQRPGVVMAALGLANATWRDLNDPDGRLRYTHDTYVKQWALTRPRLGFDVVEIDEAQDTAPVLAGVIDDQTHLQRIAVGDSCQPAGTLVAVVRGRATRAHRAVVEQVPIEQVQSGDQVVSYDIGRSFLRRTGSKVLGRTARPYEGDLVRVNTADGLSSLYTPDHHCVAQIAPALAGRHVLYVMRRGGDYRVGVTVGLSVSQNNCAGFLLRARSEDADAVWILDTFATRGEATAAETIASLTYRIPQLTFRAGNRSVITQEQLDILWSKVGGNHAGAAALLASYRREIDHPLWESGSNALLVRRAGVIRACNLLDGMTVLTLEGATAAGGKRAGRNRWSPIEVSREHYSGLVFSMTVERDHTYVGDGIITHNCQAIYGWRGAVDAMAAWPWPRRQLSQSFRFGPRLADHANLWLEALEATLRLSGHGPYDTEVAYHPEPDAILTRGNVGALVAAVQLRDEGRQVAIVGGTKDIKQLAFAARDLQEGRPTDHPELLGFPSWADVQEFVEEDGDGSDLATFVRLIDRFGYRWVLGVADDFATERGADVVVSTAHKAKGREWAVVQIAGDFPEYGTSKPDGTPVEFTREDAMLAYVAVTRAREHLDPGGLAWIVAKRPTWDDTPAGVAA